MPLFFMAVLFGVTMVVVGMTPSIWPSFLVLLTVPLSGLLLPPARARRVARDMAGVPPFGGLHASVLTGEGFSVRNPDMCREGPWSTVHAVHRAGDLAVLDHGKTAFTIVPGGGGRLDEIRSLWRGSGGAETSLRLQGRASGADMGRAFDAIGRKKWWGRVLLIYGGMATVLLSPTVSFYADLGGAVELVVTLVVIVAFSSRFSSSGHGRAPI
ncbi:MAG: hypothetical protein AAF366_00770 [Pseudomonadota bacterium]